MEKNKICVVGVGNWGLNHIHTLISLNVVIGCVDNNSDKLKKIKSRYPEILCFSSIDDTYGEDFSGYIIATPASTHSSIAIKLISSGKPVLVEKPLALSVSDSEKIKLALDKNNGKLIVGHLLLFHPAIIKMKSMIDKGLLGKIQYIYSNRLNLGTVRANENVFWSFAPHDISLFQFFSNSFPEKIESMGGDFLQKGIHDTTITYLKYPNKIQGHIYVSWLHPFKEHRLVVIGSKGTLHFEDSDDKKPLLFYEKIKSNENHILLKNKVSKKIGFQNILPLKKELEYFIQVINGAPIDRASIDEGIDIIKILNIASKTLKEEKINE